MGVQHWVRDVGWQESLELLVSRPTVNIEGLVGGYTGPGGKTILPGKALAKLDLRLVPDMTASEALAALKAHLAKRGFGDIEVNMSGGYDPTSTPADSIVIRTATAVYRRNGIDPVVFPRLAGSWPGYVFHRRTAAPARRALRPRARQRRARSRRVLRHRVEQPEGSGHRRRGALPRRIPLRARPNRLSRSPTRVQKDLHLER